MIRILLISMFLIACAEEKRPCNVDYTFHDEVNEKYIELKAKNIHDCKPYEHLP